MTIQFKDVANIDFTKVFPLINKEDYSLISGQKIILDSKSQKQLEKDNYLNISGYHISKDLIILPEEANISNIQKEIQEKVNDKFIFSEPVVDVLMAGIENNKNVLLWGRGGHGKLN